MFNRVGYGSFLRNRDLYFGIIAISLLALLYVSIVKGFLFPFIFKPMPVRSHPGVSFNDQASLILSSQNLCLKEDSPIIMKVLFISENPQAFIPDVVDIHYACNLGSVEKAFLWEPNTVINEDK